MKKQLTTEEILRRVEQRGGRTMPNAIDAERGLLGAMILHPACVHDAISRLGAIDEFETPFAHTWHTDIYRALCRLVDLGEPIDSVTVLREVNKISGGSAALSLVDALAHSAMPAMLESYIQTIEQAYRRRTVILGCERAIGLAMLSDAEERDILSEIETILFEAHEAVREQSFKEITLEVANEIAEDLQLLKRGILSGISGLDRYTNGWQPTDLIIIAARPSRGKSSLMLQLALQAIGADYHTGLFSLEMSAKRLVLRALAHEAGLDSFELRRGNIDKTARELIRKTGKTLSEQPCTLIARPELSALQMRTELRRMKLRGRLDFAIVDYVQLMSGDKRFDVREQEINHIGRSLKASALELAIPIIGLAQVNKDSVRENRSARGSDLRESDALLAHADIVIIIDDECDRKQGKDETQLSPGERVTLILDKNRDGDTGAIPVKFDRATGRWSDDYGRLGDAVKRFATAATYDERTNGKEYGEFGF